MKKNYKKYLAALAVVFGISANAQNQDWIWSWAKSSQANNSANITSIATDGSGHIFTAGGFGSGFINFDGQTLFNSEMGTNFYIAKYDLDGTIKWARKSVCQQVVLTDIASDNDGNVYGVGHFMFNMTLGDINLTSGSVWSMFIFKMDKDGTFVWAKHLGDTKRVSPESIKFKNGSLYVAGSFSVDSIVFGETTLTRQGAQDAFIAKYDTNGVAQWAKSANAPTYATATKLAIDENENIYAAGYFKEGITFGSTIVQGMGDYDTFVAKYDSNGNLLWARSEGGSGEDMPRAITTDADGNVVLTGNYYSPTITFADITHTKSTEVETDSDSYIVKYNSAGDILWSMNVEGEGDVSDLAIGKSNNILAIGTFTNNGMIIDETPLTSTAAKSIYLAAINPNGTVQWTKQAGTSGDVLSGDITVDDEHRVYIGAGFGGDMALGDTTLSRPIGTSSSLLVQFGPEVLSNPGFETNAITIYPNPATDMLHIAGIDDAAFSVWDMTGRTVLEGTAYNNTISISNLPAGMYSIKLGNGSHSKFIKQ